MAAGGATTDVDPRRAPVGDIAPARRSARDERREELLDAAIRAIRREGDGVAMEQIALEAGISRPILYRHFGDVSGLYAAVARRFGRDMARMLRSPEVARQRPGRPLLRAQIDAYVGFIANDVNVYRFLSRRPAPERGDRSRQGLFARTTADASIHFLAESGWDPQHAVVAADVMVGGIQMAVDRWVDDPAESKDALVDRLTSVLWHGLQKKAFLPPS